MIRPPPPVWSSGRRVTLRRRFRASCESCRLGLQRRGAWGAAWRIIDLLPRQLALTTAVVTAELGMTAKAAKSAHDQLADADIVVEYGTTSARGRGRLASLYVSAELLGLAGFNPLR